MKVIEIIFLVYFAYVTAYSFLFSTSALFYRARRPKESIDVRKVAVLIPAYKEDFVIVDVASQASKQHYPNDRFDVVVIADTLKPATLARLRELPIKVIEVAFEKSTKVRALNRAMEVLGDSYDCAVVLDADNVMESQFLRKMNNLYNSGCKAIQGRREPKNENTEMALLDGLSETINNFMYRQGNIALGLSSSLNGSGMFFHYGTFKQILKSMDAIGGFDRELEYKLIEHNMPVYYAKDVVVYDEKVENPEVFERQRTRWISSQFFYLRKYFGRGLRSFFKGNMSYFNSTVLRNIQLPRLINLGMLSLVTLLSFLLISTVHVSPTVWSLLLFLNILAMIFAIPTRLYNRQLLQSALMVPKIFARMLMLMFRLKGANKSFIHTPHGQVQSNAKNI